MTREPTDPDPIGPSRFAAPRTILILAVAAVCIALVLAVAHLAALGRLHRISLEFATNVTGLELRYASDVSARDEDHSMQLHGYVEPWQAASMVVGLPEAETPVPWPGATFLLSDVIAGFPHPAGGARLRGIHGCAPSTTWIGYIDPATGAFWLEILYPDSAADAPACRPAPWEPR